MNLILFYHYLLVSVAPALSAKTTPTKLEKHLLFNFENYPDQNTSNSVPKFPENGFANEFISSSFTISFSFSFLPSIWVSPAQASQSRSSGEISCFLLMYNYISLIDDSVFFNIQNMGLFVYYATELQLLNSC